MIYIQILAKALKGYISGFEDFGMPTPVSGVLERLEFISEKLEMVESGGDKNPDQILYSRARVALASALKCVRIHQIWLVAYEHDTASHNTEFFYESCFFTEKESRTIVREMYL